MPATEGLAQSFDTVAAAYDKMRPAYVDALYRMLFDYIPLDASSRAIEIGIGGGQATLPILQTGCTLTAVECGTAFSDMCREKFRDFRRFSVITDTFEHADFAQNHYDLVYSASAFHWIPENIGYPKVFSMLKRGGAFARFANHPYRDKGSPRLSAEIDRIYAEYYYPYYQKTPQTPAEYSEADAKALAQTAERYGFTDIRYALFHRTRTFTADEYCALLGTYSDHIAMETRIRTAFFAEIADAVNAHGGSITVYDIIDLQLARKP